MIQLITAELRDTKNENILLELNGEISYLPYRDDRLYKDLSYDNIYSIIHENRHLIKRIYSILIDQHYLSKSSIYRRIKNNTIRASLHINIIDEKYLCDYKNCIDYNLISIVEYVYSYNTKKILRLEHYGDDCEIVRREQSDYAPVYYRKYKIGDAVKFLHPIYGEGIARIIDVSNIPSKRNVYTCERLVDGKYIEWFDYDTPCNFLHENDIIANDKE